jgi:hypothetical protein
MMIERIIGRKPSVLVIQVVPRIRFLMVGMSEIMVPLVPMMVKSRKLSRIKFRMVKGGCIFFWHPGQVSSAGASSLPHWGHTLIILCVICPV